MPKRSVNQFFFDDHITKLFATIIPTKKAKTHSNNIRKNNQGSTNYADEHRSYLKLNSMRFTHGSVYHKYTFVNQITGYRYKPLKVLTINSKLKLNAVKASELLKEVIFSLNFVLNLITKKVIRSVFVLIKSL
jgi:hypothetical protein